MALPKLIKKCPIIDSIIEIRFQKHNRINPNAVFGMIYNALKDEYTSSESLPIMQIPEPVRINDPGFNYKPLYKVYDEKFALQIGPDVLVFSVMTEYPGWDAFEAKFLKTFKTIKDLDIFERIERLGVRYVNFFDQNIFEKVKISLNSSIEEVNPNLNPTYIKTMIVQRGYSSLLQIANFAEIAALKEIKHGSIIDIDTFQTYQDNRFLNEYQNELRNAHDVEKSIFFEILSDSFIQTLEPVYE